ncbi:hypothetical protein GIB67_021985, partial [Kingdonia uniflora]
MKPSETDMQQELEQEAMRNHIETPAIEPPAVENLLQQVVAGEGLEVVKDLVVDDDVEVEIEVNLEAISSEYGGGLLEKKGDKKYDEDEKYVEEKVKFVEEEQPQVGKEEEVQEMEESNNGDEKVDDVEKDDEEKEYEEEQPKVAEEEDSKPTVVVYYTVRKDVQHDNETKESKEEVVKGKDDDDGNSQKKPDPLQVIKEMAIDKTNLVFIESEVYVTLKKRHTLTNAKINEIAFKMACRMNQLHAHLDELLPG